MPSFHLAPCRDSTLSRTQPPDVRAQVAAMADPELCYALDGSDWGRLEASGLAISFGERACRRPCDRREGDSTAQPCTSRADACIVQAPQLSALDRLNPLACPPQARCATGTSTAATASLSRAWTCGAPPVLCATPTRTSPVTCCRCRCMGGTGALPVKACMRCRGSARVAAQLTDSGCRPHSKICGALHPCSLSRLRCGRSSRASRSTASWSPLSCEWT